MPDGSETERRMAQLLALPLFQALTEDLPKVLRFEVELCCDAARMKADAFAPWDGKPPRASYVRFQSLRPDEVLIRQGDITTEFFVVLSGLIIAQRAEPGE